MDVKKKCDYLGDDFMAFSNQNSGIITDSMGNLYNFLLDNNEITLIYFDKLMGSVEKKVVAKNCKDEFYTIIDQYDNVYLAYHESGKSVQFLSFIKGMMQSDTIQSNLQSKVYNLRIINDYEEVNVFYCIPKEDSAGQFVMYHSQRIKNKWVTKEIGSIKIYDILNPFEVVKIKDELILGYYDFIEGAEQLFIKKYNLLEYKWSDGTQLTSSINKKLYFDLLTIDGDLHVTYCEFFDGNYVVKYESFNLNHEEPHQVNSHVLSNPSNCTHPTLINHKDKLWNAWIEHDNVISAFSEDKGHNWSEPYLWNESKTEIFNRYMFSSNETNTNRIYNLNYSFGKQYPDISFLGFGNLNETTEIPLKKKEDFTKEEEQHEAEQSEEKQIAEKKTIYDEDELDDIYSTFYKPRNENPRQVKNIEREDDYMTDSISDYKKDIEEVQSELKKIKDTISELQESFKELSKQEVIQSSHSEEDFNKLSKRVEQIENYLRRRRGLFQR